MRVYLDTVALSGRVAGDLAPPAEMIAMQEIERAHHAGQLKMVTSRESWREQERTKDPIKRANFEAARADVSAVAHDHLILGFNHQDSQFGTVAVTPILTEIVDDALFTDLKTLGLEPADARHLMYASVNSCDRFLTLDPDFFDRRSELQKRCPSVRIVRPTELVIELSASLCAS